MLFTNFLSVKHFTLRSKGYIMSNQLTHGSSQQGVCYVGDIKSPTILKYFFLQISKSNLNELEIEKKYICKNNTSQSNKSWKNKNNLNKFKCAFLHVKWIAVYNNVNWCKKTPKTQIPLFLHSGMKKKRHLIILIKPININININIINIAFKGSGNVRLRGLKCLINGQVKPEVIISHQDKNN